MNKDLSQLTEIIERCNDIYRRACGEKEIARTQKEKPELYLKASESFQQASELSQEIACHPDAPRLNRLSGQINSAYYASEYEDNLKSYYYTIRDTSNARIHLDKATKNLKKTIELIKKALPEFEEEEYEHYQYQLTLYSYFLRRYEIDQNSLDARSYWDSGHFIKALDYYREIARNYKDLLDNFPSTIPLEYKRIAKANYIGALANISASLAQFYLKSEDVMNQGDIAILPNDLAIEVLKQILLGYKFGIAAYKTNPEWNEYRQAAEVCRKNIENFLRSNPTSWKTLLIELKDDEVLVQFMRNIDPQSYENIHNFDKSQNSPKKKDKDEIDIIILTAIPKEYEEVKKHVINISRCSEYRCDIAEFESSTGLVRIALAMTGRTNADAQAKTTDMISRVHPRMAIFVGVAGGIKNDADIGDVIVANQINYFESGKLKDGQFLARPKVKESTPRLVDLARNLSDKSWMHRLKSKKKDIIPKIFIEPIASGDKLITDLDSQEIARIKRHFNDSYAIEMEGYGFLLACAYADLSNRIVIRGISDNVDNKEKSDVQGTQELASANAAAFAFEMINAEWLSIHSTKS